MTSSATSPPGWWHKNLCPFAAAEHLFRRPRSPPVMTQIQPSRAAALSPAAYPNEQANPLAAYSRSLLDFHQKLWNEARRKCELESRVCRAPHHHSTVKNKPAARRAAQNSN